VRNRGVLPRAKQIMDRGMYLGSAGQFEQALQLFIEAGTIDGYNPDAPYQQGFTLMKLGRYHEAVVALRHAERLAPGWYHVGSNLWLAEAAANNRLPGSLINDILVLDDLDSPSMKGKPSSLHLHCYSYCGE
jgi:tetratricopeptide (TPR) repeat protein